MALIEMRPEELKYRANEIEQLRQQHIEIMKQFRIIILGLSEDWKGEAQEALVQKFMDFSQTMANMEETLGQYVVLAKNAADNAVGADQELSNLINQLMG